jgi:hypothetical protein
MRPNIRDAITLKADVPISNRDLVALALRIENSTKRGRFTTEPVVGRDSYGPKRKKQCGSPPRKSKGSEPRRSDAPLLRDASNIVCFNCDKKGYYANKCCSPKKGSAPSTPA